jgi:flavodoxin I
MERIGIIYGSTTGATAKVAESIRKVLGEDRSDLLEVSSIGSEDLKKYDNLILGVSTWGLGDMQDEWEAKLSLLKETDLKEKTVALFGLGDQEGYPDTYLDAMGTLYDLLIAGGVTPVGEWPTDGYSFDKSTAVRDRGFVGLALDEDNQAEKTQERIVAWLVQLENKWRR